MNPRPRSYCAQSPSRVALLPRKVSSALLLGVALGGWGCASDDGGEEPQHALASGGIPTSTGGVGGQPGLGGQPVGGTAGLGGAAGETGGTSGGSGGVPGAAGGTEPATGGTGTIAGTTITIEEEQLGFCTVEGVVESEHGGYTASGYVNTTNLAGAGVEWSVDAAGGDAVLVFKYAANSDRSARLLINGVEAATLDFASTGDWASWAEATATTSLAAGENAIRLEASSDLGLPNLDHLTLTTTNPVPQDCAPEIVIPDSSVLVGFATLNGGTTGGEGGEVVTVSTYSELKRYAESYTPYVILIEGTITNGSAGGQIRVASDKSLIGVGSAATLSGVGIDIGDSRSNIIVRNLAITLVGTTNPGSVNGGDCIGISGNSTNIWIDHCEIYSEDPDTQTDINKYDGLIDIKGQTGFITLSWNYLHDHHKGGLVGAADNDLYADRKVTMHHNYYNKVKLRVPMYRGSTGHFFNNYIVGATDATEIRAGTCVRVEKNYYESLHYSIYTPSDSPGSTERIDNIEVERASRAYPANCTANIPYDYSSALTTNTADVKLLVPAGAGVGKIAQ